MSDSHASLTFAEFENKSPLIIDDAVGFATDVFLALQDRLAVYDRLAGADPAGPIASDEIHAMNSAMSTHAPVEPLTKRATSAAATGCLAALEPAWSLFGMSDREWAAGDVADKIDATFSSMGAKWPNVAVVSKLLYLKRPNLVPILDSYVIEQVGASSLRDTIGHLRRQGIENLGVLVAIRDALRGHGIERSELRILETCLWASHARSPVALPDGRWTRSVRVAQGVV